MEKKVVVITGASSGIGKALALEFARQGYFLVLGARNIQALEEVKNAMPNTSKVACKQTDVCMEDECKQLIEFAISQFGGMDVLINNAGISMRALFAETQLEVIKKLMDVNFWGMVYCTHYAIPHLLISKGSVICISSIAGYRGLPARTGYSASKFAMNGFMEALRTENLHTGLHCLTVCPGFTQSNIRMTALNAGGQQQGESPRNEQKMMSAEEVAALTYKAYLQKKKTLTLTLQGQMTVFLNKWLNVFMDTIVFNTMAKEPDSPFKRNT